MRRRKRRTTLVPRDQVKNVIYLDRRGYRGKKKVIPAILFWGLSVLSLAYCVGIALFVAYGSKFFLIWGVCSVFFGGLGYLMLHPDTLQKIPKWVKRGFFVCCAVGVGMLALIEGMILDSFHASPVAGADYCVVLGARWMANGPGYILQKRLDKAVEYLEMNADTKVIVSGGKGSDEPVSEAEGMRQYLTQQGIAPERILVEDMSLNTWENLANSSQLLDPDKDRVVLVTSNFHLFRACAIARKMGYAHLEGAAADSYLPTLPNNLLREFFGVLKDSLVGNM